MRLGSQQVADPVTGDVVISGNDIVSKKVTVSGTVTPKPQPALNVDKTSLAFTTTTNTASAVQTYQLTASNLTANAVATVTAPTGYEVRLGSSGTVFSGKLSVASFNGSINAPVSVRLKSTFTAGTVDGTLTNVVAGLSKPISLTGKVNLPPSLTLNPISLSGFSTTTNQASAGKTYTLKVLNLAGSATATVTAPTGYELRIQNTGSFAGTLTLNQTAAGTIDRTIEVRLKGQATTGTVTGSVSHSAAGLSKTLQVTGTVKPAGLAAGRTEAPPSAEEPLNLHVNAFPNPVTDLLSVAFQARAGLPVRVQLYRPDGQQITFREVLATGDIQQVTLPMGNLNNGLYLLEVASPLMREVVKVVKQ